MFWCAVSLSISTRYLYFDSPYGLIQKKGTICKNTQQYYPSKKYVSKDICIIWQDSIKVNPSILIGSYSIRILQYKPFLWKWSYVVYF